MECNPANPKGSGIVDVWQEELPVRFGAIDRSDKLTLDAVFQYFQEAAISHADNLGVGKDDFVKAGQAWILSRMTVLVKRRPKYCECLKVRSWPCGSEKLFAIRNYDIRDKDDIAVVSARSTWLIVDIEKRRPLRPQQIIDKLPPNVGLESLTAQDAGAAALTVQNNLQKVCERKALYTDIDYNGHVNNVRYIQWIEDTLDPQLLENAGQMRFDINYLSEILAGEVTEILSLPLENTDYTKAFAFEGRKQKTAQPAFRAELFLRE